MGFTYFKVKVTHQGEGHIKVKVKYLHPFKFYVSHALCKRVVCIQLKCYLFKNIFCLKALAVSWVWDFCSMISKTYMYNWYWQTKTMKLCCGLWKGNQGHKGPCLPQRRVYLATETVNFHTWITLLIRKSLRIKEPSSPKKENEKKINSFWNYYWVTVQQIHCDIRKFLLNSFFLTDTIMIMTDVQSF